MISETAYLTILTAIVAERFFELWLSRRNAERAFSRGGIESGQTHYKLLVILHVLFLVSCAIESLLHAPAFPRSLEALALIGAIGAQLVRYWAVLTLGDRWNTRIVVIPGEAPIATGPFRYVRHPNYLAVIMEIACLPLIRALWITAIVFSLANAIVLSVRISAEELAMGQTYAEIFASRARFIPGSGRRR